MWISIGRQSFLIRNMLWLRTESTHPTLYRGRTYPDYLKSPICSYFFWANVIQRSSLCLDDYLSGHVMSRCCRIRLIFRAMAIQLNNVTTIKMTNPRTITCQILFVCGFGKSNSMMRMYWWRMMNTPVKERISTAALRIVVRSWYGLDTCAGL